MWCIEGKRRFDASGRKSCKINILKEMKTIQRLNQRGSTLLDANKHTHIYYYINEYIIFYLLEVMVLKGLAFIFSFFFFIDILFLFPLEQEDSIE